MNSVKASQTIWANETTRFAHFLPLFLPHGRQNFACRYEYHILISKVSEKSESYQRLQSSQILNSANRFDQRQTGYLVTTSRHLSPLPRRRGRPMIRSIGRKSPQNRKLEIDPSGKACTGDPPKTFSLHPLFLHLAKRPLMFLRSQIEIGLKGH